MRAEAAVRTDVAVLTAEATVLTAAVMVEAAVRTEAAVQTLVPCGVVRIRSKEKTAYGGFGAEAALRIEARY